VGGRCYQVGDRERSTKRGEGEVAGLDRDFLTAPPPLGEKPLAKRDKEKEGEGESKVEESSDDSWRGGKDRKGGPSVQGRHSLF